MQNGDHLEYLSVIRSEYMRDNAPQFVKINNHGLKLHRLKSEIGDLGAGSILIVLITKFVRTFNVSKNMDDDQILDLAMSLLDTGIVDGYTLEDYAVFFEKAKTGKYGKPFDYVDAGLINSMLDKYHQDRQSEIYRENIRIHENMKKGIYEDAESSEIHTTPARIKAIEEMAKRFYKSKEEMEMSEEEKEKARLARIERKRKLFESRFKLKVNESPQQSNQGS